MKHTRVYVTDHAVVRYLERVKGIDMDAVRAEIAAHVDLALEHDGVSGVLSDGFRYRLQGLTVTTVVQASQPDLRTRRGRK